MITQIVKKGDPNLSLDLSEPWIFISGDFHLSPVSWSSTPLG